MAKFDKYCVCYTNIDNFIDPYRAGIDFSRQNLTSVDVRF